MHLTALPSFLALILLPCRTMAQSPFPMECRAGCNNCVYACYTLHLWTPVGLDCSMCQDCVLTEVPGCEARNKNPPVDDPFCTTVCDVGIIPASCRGLVICADDEWIPPETSTVTWTQSPTPSPSPMSNPTGRVEAFTVT